MDVSTVVHGLFGSAGIDSFGNTPDGRHFSHFESNCLSIFIGLRESAEMLSLEVNIEEGLGILDVCLARIIVSEPLEEPIHSFMVEATRVVDVGPVVKELKTIQLDPGLTIKTAGLAVVSPLAPHATKLLLNRRSTKIAFHGGVKLGKLGTVKLPARTTLLDLTGEIIIIFFLLYDWVGESLYLFTMVNIF